jgi:acetolactate synthase-1/2/3 large subunit
MINKHSKGDAIMVSDVGQHQMFTCRYAKFNSKSNVTGGLGTMGFALPAAIGAKMGMPNRKWLQLSVMVDSK